MSSNIKMKSSFERRRYYSYRKVPQTPNPNTAKKRFTIHEYEKVIQELLEKIDYLESHLAEMGMDKIKILSSNRKINSDNNYLIEQIKLKERKNSELQKKNLNKSQKIESINKKYKDMRSSYDNKLDIINKQLIQKSEDINDLEDKMKSKDDKIIYMELVNDISFKEIQKQLSQLNALKLLNKSQEEKIFKLQNELDQLLLEKRSEGNLLLQINHLKEDNKRLVELLSITDKFSDFAFLSQSIPGGIRYLSDKNIKKMPPRMKATFIKQKIESLNSWIPGAAYDRLLEFNHLHNIKMDEDLINELLYKLNQVFREKEQKNLTKMKNKFQEQIFNLMNKYGIKNVGAPYNVLEVELMKKKNNKKIKQEQKKEKENKKTEEIADEMINYAKTTTTSYLLERKKNSDGKILNLKDKIVNQNLNNNKIISNNNIDDINKNNLLGERIIKEISKIKNKFEKIEKEFRSRINDNDIINENDFNNKIIVKENIKTLKSSIEWMISSMKDYLNDCMNHFMKIKK